MVLKVIGNTMSEMSPQEFKSEQNVNSIPPNSSKRAETAKGPRHCNITEFLQK
jgi:hypothetical protein